MTPQHKSPFAPFATLAATLAAMAGLAGCGPEREASSSSPGAGSGASTQPADDRTLVVFTTFYPTQYFAERIAGTRAAVVCPVPEDADPIFWMPDAETIAAYQEADLIILNGAGFEKWAGQVSLPESRVVRTADGFADEFLHYEDAVTHSHGNEGEHSHEGLDGHTWVDPVNAKRQARAIADALAARLPSQTGEFDKNFDALAADLDALDDALARLSGRASPPLLASHPAYNYLAKRYGWDIVNLDLDPEEVPDDTQVTEIRKFLEAHPAKTLLWEGEPIAEAAQRVKDELGLASVTISPCELRGGSSGGDYLDVMRQNIDKLESVFQ